MNENNNHNNITNEELSEKIDMLTDNLIKITKKVNIIFWLVIVAVVLTVLGWWFPTLF